MSYSFLRIIAQRVVTTRLAELYSSRREVSLLSDEQTDRDRRHQSYGEATCPVPGSRPRVFIYKASARGKTSARQR